MLKTKIGLLAAVPAAIWAGSMCLLSSSPSLAQPVTVESASPLGNKDAGKAETAVGDLVADVLKAELQTNIAFVAASELKPKDPPYPAGEIPSTDITALISYPDDPLAVLILSGETVRKALEKSVSIYPQPNLGFLQVSGLEFTFDSSKPAGKRVTSIKLKGTPMNDDYYYTVGVTNSLANGALGYWKIWSKEDVKQRFPDTTAVKAVENYLRANSKIDYSKFNRITAAQ